MVHQFYNDNAAGGKGICVHELWNEGILWIYDDLQSYLFTGNVDMKLIGNSLITVDKKLNNLWIT